MPRPRRLQPTSEVPRATTAVARSGSAPCDSHAQTTDKTLQRIRDSKAITIAYRTDAPPFSYEDRGQPAGYTVDCKRIVTSLEQQLKVQPIAVKWVPANVQTRLDLVSKGQVDLECGTTTATLSRMDQVDFSNPVWVDATGLLVRKSLGAHSIGGPGGQEHRQWWPGTPNERALEDALKKGLVNAKVVPGRPTMRRSRFSISGSVDALAAGQGDAGGHGQQAQGPLGLRTVGR